MAGLRSKDRIGYGVPSDSRLGAGAWLMGQIRACLGVTVVATLMLLVMGAGNVEVRTSTSVTPEAMPSAAPMATDLPAQIHRGAIIHSILKRELLRQGKILSSPGLQRPARANVPLIAPIFTNGPSNQIYQAKEAVFNIRRCKRSLTLVFPPIRPHFTAHKRDVEKPFSKFFQLQGRGSASILEEHKLSSTPGTWPQEVCTLYYSSDVLGNRLAAQKQSDPMLAHCKKYGSLFLERTNNTLCKSLEFVNYSGSFCSLAADIKKSGKQRQLSLACNLNYPSVPRHALIHEKILGADFHSWISTAQEVRLRHYRKLNGPTLAIQMRLPDSTPAHGNRRAQEGYICVCIHKGCKKCDPAVHVYVHVDRLVAFIRRQLQESPVMQGISEVYIMSSDENVASSVGSGLQAAGYAVTISGDARVEGLLRDYDVAVQSKVFWATHASSIATNIIHARLSEGRPLESVVYWEDLWTRASNVTK